MVIQNIKLTNWKNFQNCEIKLSDRVIVIGPNAVGKSNFLDALRFLRDIVKQGGGLQSAVEDRGGVKKIRCLAARINTNICIDVTLGDESVGKARWNYHLEFKNNGGGIVKTQTVVVNEKVVNLQKEEVLVDRKETDPEEDVETLKYTHLEQPTVNKAFREIKDTFSSMQYLNVIPEMMRDHQNIMYLAKEDYYGYKLLDRMAKLNRVTLDSYMERINHVMRCIIPQLEKFTFSKDNTGHPHIEAIYLHWRAQGAKQDETMFSDGTLRMLGFLFAMLDGNGIILLEEPEINLHSAVVAQLPSFIAEIQRNKKRQVILTTHSYDILANEGIRGDEVLVLESDAESTTVRNLNEEELLLLEDGMSVADIMMNKTAPNDIDKLNR